MCVKLTYLKKINTSVISAFMHFEFKAVEKCVQLLHLCCFSSNFNIVTPLITGNMLENGVVLMESDGDSVS
jgi:hypothetical protein